MVKTEHNLRNPNGAKVSYRNSTGRMWGTDTASADNWFQNKWGNVGKKKEQIERNPNYYYQGHHLLELLTL